MSEEDLLVYILTQLGEGYNSIISTVRVREKPLSLGELVDVLTDHERQLKDADEARQLFYETKVCRKLARFLKVHNVLTAQTPPTVQSAQASPHWLFNSDASHHATSASLHWLFDSDASHHATSASPHWLFDSDASHHATSSLTSLQTLSEYNGSDEVHLGDGLTSLQTLSEYNGSDEVHLGDGNFL
ncbi:PREDICTED: uncharacterized protein LOC109160809 [Ipomoea nil]|uniref:uncharacterized protein LOC109160809 n=1 Tax=Ipomoea nil TaxID=35883 RepID=UPI000900F12B|nr:PREDICTED: uncharacterized protein LOC109160809 [Ipomoea nil]